MIALCGTLLCCVLSLRLAVVLLVVLCVVSPRVVYRGLLRESCANEARLIC